MNRLKKRLIPCVAILVALLPTAGCGTTVSTEQHKQPSPSNPSLSKPPNDNSKSNSQQDKTSSIPSSSNSTATETNLLPEQIAFWNAKDGLLLAVRGQDQEGYIEGTHDGGKTWQVIYHGGKNIAELSVDNNGDAWATVQLTGDVTKDLQVIHSSDQGSMWETLNNGIPYERFFKGVGWAWKGTTLYKTTDQGNTWTPFSPPDMGKQWEGYRAWFASTTNGWLLKTTQGGTGQMGKQIDETTNGGRSWDTVINVPFATPGNVDGLISGGYPIDIFFFPDGHGWMWDLRGPLYITQDGGHHWTSSLSTAADGNEVRSAWFLTEDEGYAIFNTVTKGNVSLVLRITDDGGKTWRTVQTWPQT